MPLEEDGGSVGVVVFLTTDNTDFWDAFLG